MIKLNATCVQDFLGKKYLNQLTWTCSFQSFLSWSTILWKCHSFLSLQGYISLDTTSLQKVVTKLVITESSTNLTNKLMRPN